MVFLKRCLFASFVLISYPLLSASPVMGQAVSSKPDTTASPKKTGDQEKSDKGDLSVGEISSLLQAIPPYLPKTDVSAEIHLFGSTSMDAMAHNWATAFKRFHPKSKIVISAHGTEEVFERLSKESGSIGMMSRPVSQDDLNRLKSLGLKRPVAIQVARDALGVFVNQSNPLTTIAYPQLVQLFCKDPREKPVTWGTVGVDGSLKEQRVNRLGRSSASGTQTFISKYLFHKYQVEGYTKEFKSNSEAIQAVSKDQQAITIGEFNSAIPGVRRLKLRDSNRVLEGDDHEILLGRYPITRPMTLVFDLDNADQAVINSEFIRFALAREGQTKAILAGLYPYDPPTLRAQLAKLKTAKESE